MNGWPAFKVIQGDAGLSWESLPFFQQNPDVLLRYVISEGNDLLAAYPTPAEKRLITNKGCYAVSNNAGAILCWLHRQ